VLNGNLFRIDLSYVFAICSKRLLKYSQAINMRVVILDAFANSTTNIWCAGRICRRKLVLGARV